MLFRHARPFLRATAALVATAAVLSVPSHGLATESDMGAADPSTVMVKLGPSFTTHGEGSVTSAWRALPVQAGETVADAIERLSADPAIIEVAPNYRYTQLNPPPDDPYYPQQWHLRETGVPTAWDTSTGASVTIAIVDGGVSHEGTDLACHTFVAPFNSSTGATSAGAAEPTSNDAHGTHVTGTAAQCTNNAVGAAGVAPGASIMPIRVSDDAGSLTSEYLADGILWAVDHGADVINISLGITGGCSTDWPTCGDPAVDDAIAHAAAAGVIVVAASGNEAAAYVTYPGNHPSVMSVGATTAARTRASYSSFGTALSIMAPGDHIYQESFTSLDEPESWGVRSGSGTSFAAPQVAAVAAQVLAANPVLTALEVAAILEDTALDLGAPGWDSVFGHGLVQADAAVEAAAGPIEGGPVSILGGTLAVAQSVADEISVLTGSVPERLAGEDRYATAVAISQSGFPDGASTVYVATGLAFPDALSVGPVAAIDGSPVLLVDRETIPSVVRSELTRLSPVDIVVIGGPLAVSDSVLSDLSNFASSGTAQRVGGMSRYDTSVAVSVLAFAPGIDTVYVATGAAHPDALVAGAAAAAVSGPVLLTPRDQLPDAVRDEILRLSPSRVVLVGGPLAVSEVVASEIAALGPPVHRINGGDRYATAAAVAAYAFPQSPAPSFVAVGTAFPDAVAGTPLAAIRGGPILLTETDLLPPSTAEEIARLSENSP